MPNATLSNYLVAAAYSYNVTYRRESRFEERTLQGCEKSDYCPDRRTHVLGCCSCVVRQVSPSHHSQVDDVCSDAVKFRLLYMV